jgi:hypothetical protein
MTSKTDQRRALNLIAETERRVTDLEQSRPTDAPVTVFRELDETGVVATDTVTHESVADARLRGNDVSQGYVLGEWGVPDGTRGYTGTPPATGYGTGEYGSGAYGDREATGYDTGEYGGGGYGSDG